MLTSPRKRNETILLAVLSIFSVVPLRFFVESRGWFLTEMSTLAALFCLWQIQHRLLSVSRWSVTIVKVVPLLLASTPVVFAVLSRSFGSPIAFEMSALSTFGAVSLAIALAAASSRTRSMSLVISGFLVLFTTSISDDPRAVWLAIFWITVCVWHLVANHWERLDLCLPDAVRPTVGVRPVSVAFAIVLCLLGGLLVRDRFGPSNRFDLGFMPTSGGSKWSDPAARSGIGTGEAAIAAKDHAESFGAVESEIFLESTESTLFDMFNDMIGEPKMKKNKWERRQGMMNENIIPSHERAAKSEKGGSSFSTDRMRPKKHHHFKDSVEAAVVQWDGPTGIRLAMHRFDSFDGVDWSNAAELGDAKLLRRDLDDQVWFFDRKLHGRVFDDADAVDVNLLKVLRLDSTRLPSPMMTAGIHIKDVDRQDFFGIEGDGSLYMPGREKVPPLTVVNLASLKIMEDELWDQIAVEPSRASHQADTRNANEGNASDSERSEKHVYAQLQAIVADLRNNYTLDRNAANDSEDPLAHFLKTRRGGDYLFATVAALKAREIGLQSRLVTGFYVRPSSFDITAGHSSVTAEDVHVWTEIQLADGRWFEIEPTPGYREPVYTPSMGLMARRFAAQHWMNAVAILVVIVLLFGTRVVWIEWLLSIAWSLSWTLGRKRQLRVAMQILETRAKLIGKHRPTGTPQRDWMESLVARDVNLRDRVREFCNDADKITFGGSGEFDRRRLSGVVRGLNTRQLKQINREVTR